MTVHVNFDASTGFSYLDVVRNGNKNYRMEPRGPEKPTTKYTFNPTMDHTNVGAKTDAATDTFERQSHQDRVAGMKAHLKNLSSMQKTAFDTRSSMRATAQKRVEAVYGSFYGGVEIDGLDEMKMISHWEKFKSTSDPGAEFYKGAAFGWPSVRDRTSHSAIARVLAIGLPAGMKKQVSIGVKARWTAHDVQVYAEEIWLRMR